MTDLPKHQFLVTYHTDQATGLEIYEGLSKLLKHFALRLPCGEDLHVTPVVDLVDWDVPGTMLACNQLLLAYAKGEANGSHIEWGDVDLAVEMAKYALPGVYEETVLELKREADYAESPEEYDDE
jgi:hypothetical protein